jgi:molecular chaperone DnaJ
MKSYYQILCVEETATADEIKKVFRKLARENHPDTHPGDTAKEHRFKEIALAYETLGDAEKRKKYDAERTKKQMGNKTRKRPEPRNPFECKTSFDDMFDDMFNKSKAETSANSKSPLNTDDMFSKFMGFKFK